MGSAYDKYMEEAKATLRNLQAEIDEKPKLKSAERKKIENRMSALRSRMRKKEQS